MPDRHSTLRVVPAHPTMPQESKSVKSLLPQESKSVKTLLQAIMQLIKNACSSSSRHPMCCTCSSDRCQAGPSIWHALLISKHLWIDAASRWVKQRHTQSNTAVATQLLALHQFDTHAVSILTSTAVAKPSSWGT